ncbi:MAG: DUF1080 domain-containing protein [Phycisphaerae bacterium]
MRTLLAITVAAAMLGGCSSDEEVEPAPPAKPEGLPPVETLLSDSFVHWVQRGGLAAFSMEEGVITGVTRADQSNSFLCTREIYRDFELTLEFKVDNGLNSGVQVRSQWRQEGNLQRVFGYQVEIDTTERRWTGGIYDEGRRGWLFSPKDPAAIEAFKPGEWNAMRVLCEGDRIRTWINGVPVSDLADSATPRGFIALRVPGVGSRRLPMKAQWRDIRVIERQGTPPASLR